MYMIVSVSSIKSCELVNGSSDCFQVVVSVSPQVQPLILNFLDLQDATAFVARCYSSDGQSYVASVMKYLDGK